MAFFSRLFCSPFSQINPIAGIRSKAAVQRAVRDNSISARKNPLLCRDIKSSPANLNGHFVFLLIDYDKDRSKKVNIPIHKEFEG